jgi:hypothetical protein
VTALDARKVRPPVSNTAAAVTTALARAPDLTTNV